MLIIKLYLRFYKREIRINCQVNILLHKALTNIFYKHIPNTYTL